MLTARDLNDLRAAAQRWLPFSLLFVSKDCLSIQLLPGERVLIDSGAFLRNLLKYILRFFVLFVIFLV